MVNVILIEPSPSVRFCFWHAYFGLQVVLGCWVEQHPYYWKSSRSKDREGRYERDGKTSGGKDKHSKVRVGSYNPGGAWVGDKVLRRRRSNPVPSRKLKQCQIEKALLSLYRSLACAGRIKYSLELVQASIALNHTGALFKLFCCIRSGSCILSWIGVRGRCK